MPTDKPITTGVRLPAKNRIALDDLAERFHNTPAGMIRLAVDNLIMAVEANGGQLPPGVAAMKTDNAEASAAAGKENGK